MTNIIEQKKGKDLLQIPQQYQPKYDRSTYQIQYEVSSYVNRGQDIKNNDSQTLQEINQQLCSIISNQSEFSTVDKPDNNLEKFLNFVKNNNNKTPNQSIQEETNPISTAKGQGVQPCLKMIPKLQLHLIKSKLKNEQLQGQQNSFKEFLLQQPQAIKNKIYKSNKNEKTLKESLNRPVTSAVSSNQQIQSKQPGVKKDFIFSKFPSSRISQINYQIANVKKDFICRSSCSKVNLEQQIHPTVLKSKISVAQINLLKSPPYKSRSQHAFNTPKNIQKVTRSQNQSPDGIRSIFNQYVNLSRNNKYISPTKNKFSVNSVLYRFNKLIQ